jgi:purine-binding chemotaxis protein CheW
MPVHVRGVINLRGSVLPVVDLAAKFGGAELEPSRTTCIVVVETMNDNGATIVVGLIADAVSQVVDLPASLIEPAPSFGTNIRVDFLAGMAKLGARLALVLDIDRVLSPAEIEETVSQPIAINNNDAASDAAQI